MTVCDLFAGIGGFSLGLERSGMTIKYQVEIDAYCRKILAKHWPEVQRFQDVRTVDPDQIGSVDLVCGGFPCQPFSVAGDRKGQGDDRHLWPEMLRIISALRPAWVVGENAPGIVSLGLDDVLLDLEREGYTCQSLIIPACAVGAPHRRERVWIVAHSGQSGLSIPKQEKLQGEGRGKERGATSEFCRWPAEPGMDRVAYGIPGRVDRLKALGNAVVPQVVEQIGRAIMLAHRRGSNLALERCETKRSNNHDPQHQPQLRRSHHLSGHGGDGAGDQKMRIRTSDRWTSGRNGLRGNPRTKFY